MSERLKRILVLFYGTTCYALFFGCFLYAIGFVGDFIVPKTVNSGPESPLGEALLLNGLLLTLFALQHTGMARRSFKRAWTKLVPASVERPTYVLATVVAFVLLFWLWRPMTATVWDATGVSATALTAVSFAGWGLVLLATIMINHFDLFGLRQTWLRFRGQPYTELGFRTPGIYRWVRHPIQLGFLIAFWATPHMTVGHLLFAAGSTGYILVALLAFEEKDLVREFGDKYRNYKRQTSMFVPVPRPNPWR